MTVDITKTVLGASGINCEALENEFTEVIEKHGFNHECLTLEELREVMAQYLNEVFLELLDPENTNAS